MAGESCVWVKGPNGDERRAVTTGLSNNRFVRILSGLAAGEMVSLAPPLKDSAGTAETDLLDEAKAERPE